MKDEIKEILDKLEIVARKHTIEVCEDGSKIETMPASVVDELRLNNYSSKVLLDYITNLKDTLKDREEYCYGLETQITNLQEENKRLKEDFKRHIDRINELTKRSDNLQEENANQEYTIKTLLKGNVDVCNRNKKAIEYIEDNTHYFSTDTKEIYFSIDTETDEEFCNTLENILIGSDNNE